MDSTVNLLGIKERNPVASNGDVTRNFDCPHYSECLDHAIAMKWTGWRCDRCYYREARESMNAH